MHLDKRLSSIPFLSFERIKVSESGIKNADNIKELVDNNVNAVLIGEKSNIYIKKLN